MDPICGTTDARFFRLRRLLDAPPVEVSNFRLIDTTGGARELYYQKLALAVAVVLAGTNLTSAIPLVAELDRVRLQAGRNNLPIWIISASDAVSRDVIAEIAKSFPPDIPILQDPSHAVHRTLGSGRTPEAVLISPSDWSIAYRGPVEEITDTGAGVVHTRPLSDAVAELAANNPISVSRMEVVGNPAGLRPITAAQYSTQVAPLLLKSCMPCHSTGNIAPWAMTNHATIGVFSKLIKSSVLAGEMPPWHADPKYQQFENAKALASEEIAMIVDWIDRGSPRGNSPDPLADAVQQPLEDWPLGKPDAILSIAPQAVPANGAIDYKYLTAKSPFSTDVWLRAVAVKPGDRSVVHHCLVFKGSVADLLAVQGGLSGFFAAYVPGMDQVSFPQGTGKLLKRTDTIVFQMHYTASGKATTDRTQLGFYLAPVKPAKELVTTAAFETDFIIPPMTPEVPISAARTFAKKSLIYELSPHMHYRGASARFTLVYPNGNREVLLNVPNYLFNWQTLYRLANPKEARGDPTRSKEHSTIRSGTDSTRTLLHGEIRRAVLGGDVHRVSFGDAVLVTTRLILKAAKKCCGIPAQCCRSKRSRWHDFPTSITVAPPITCWLLSLRQQAQEVSPRAGNDGRRRVFPIHQRLCCRLSTAPSQRRRPAHDHRDVGRADFLCRPTRRWRLSTWRPSLPATR